jgi:hypothetical protein
VTLRLLLVEDDVMLGAAIRFGLTSTPARSSF